MSSPALAQHKIAYIDSDKIYQNYPEFTTAQQSLDRLAQQWEQDLAERQAALDEMFKEYQARELLYTSESRQERQNEIIAAEEELERMRMQYFGPEGQLFHQQEQILRPIQERVLTVIQEVAEGEGYDYVFDRNGDFVFLYANESLNITDLVLEELGVDITRIIGQ
ncbi:MAG: OmpH family outer membrane protein [Bacteroidetes bacterium]|nr:OmpH family outer membrane protein [Bacteroidota bacterium]MDE2671807.1 OmpH family outer membrane protein [Bacteroidota bacterium]